MNDNRFTHFAAHAVWDQRLTAGDVRVLAALGTFTDKNGWCWPSQKTMAEKLGITVPSVSSAITKLTQMGYVEKVVKTEEGKGRRGCIYRVRFDQTDQELLDAGADLSFRRNRLQPKSAPAEIGSGLSPTSAYAEVGYIEEQTQKNKPTSPKPQQTQTQARSRKATLPLPFTPRDRERAIAFNELRMTGAEFETCLAEFIDWASTKGRRVVGEPNWNRTFENDLRRTAANWKTSFRKQTPNPFKAYANGSSAQAEIGAALPTAPEWWAAAAAAIHEHDAAAWRAYGASAKAALNDAGERVIFTAGSVSCERLAKIVDALETTGRISGPPIFVKPPPRANVPSTN